MCPDATCGSLISATCFVCVKSAVSETMTDTMNKNPFTFQFSLFTFHFSIYHKVAPCHDKEDAYPLCPCDMLMQYEHRS